MGNLEKAKSAKGFWDVMKTVSVGQIAKDAEKQFTLAVVGPPERRLDVLHRLYPGRPEDEVRPALRGFDTAREQDGFPAEGGGFDIVIDAGAADAPSGTGVYSVEGLGGWDRLVERLLEERRDLALSLARRFPGLREPVARRIIRETAKANAQFSMLNALPGLLPILGLLLPTTAIGDIIILAKNQAMMLFRLAAAHDLPLDLRSRSGDLAPLIGNAFGWRAIAREVFGVVPGGIGMIARGTIAYAGTVALGEALRRLYAHGQQPTRAEIRFHYRQAFAGAREAVREMARRLRDGKHRALPPADDEAARRPNAGEAVGGEA